MRNGETMAHAKQNPGQAPRPVRGVRSPDRPARGLRGVSGLRVAGVRDLPAASNVPAGAWGDQRGVRVDEVLEDPVSSREAIEAFLGETDLRGCKPTTRATRARVLKDFASYQHRSLVAWGQGAADDWYRARMKAAKATTVGKEILILRGFFRWLEEAGLTPPWRIRLRKPRRSDPGTARYRHVSREDMERMAAAIRPRHADAVRAMWLTGLRVGELILSQPEHVDGGALWVPPAKTTRGRMVPLEPGALEALRGYWSQPRATQEAIRQAMALVGDASPHDLRHSRAKEWLREGHALHDVSGWLGHTSVAMTQRYLDVRATSPMQRRQG